MIREQVDARIEQLLENPRQQPRSAYDETTDQWTTVYGGGVGLIVYAVVHPRQRLIILRLVCELDENRRTRSIPS